MKKNTTAARREENKTADQKPIVFNKVPLIDFLRSIFGEVEELTAEELKMLEPNK